MQLKWAEIFILVCVFHACTAEPGKVVDEGQKETVLCSLKREPSVTFMWFRAAENTGVEFIVSYKNNKKVSNEELPESVQMTDGYTLVINSFKKETHSGSYNCARYNSYSLTFGKATRLEGKPDIKPTEPPKAKTTCKNITPATAATKPCVCPNRRVVKPDSEKRCDLFIWAPLAGGCGLLLVLLIVVSLVCNSIRTRRCPHHYKRQPRTAGGMLHPGHNRPV